ncbi:light-independent protochlorophyllide reductase subunit B [Gemmatimonadetes bacterium T265]|nr:light-independent protochlorophyllide reductase subunit B [Gemmatimonadetes bacterium T265]
MQLTLWTYEGPPHVGAMRVAASMAGVHYVLHAPQGDTYADLLFTMIERADHRPPVSYTTFQARDLGGDTAGLVIEAVRDAAARFAPDALLVGESCTAELIQDQAGALAKSLGLAIPVVPLELPAYSKKENWGAAETFYQLVRATLLPNVPAPGTPRPPRDPARRPVANVLGPTALGFRARDDVRELRALMAEAGVDVGVVAPLGATVADLRRLPEADLNVCYAPETALSACEWLRRTFGQPVVRTVPIGVGATGDFLRELAAAAGLDAPNVRHDASRLPWYSRSADSTYLTGKRVFVFGDATHACAAARVAVEELGLDLVGLGTYSRELAREVRATGTKYDVEAFVSDDYLDVEARVAAAAPELVLGTQMERHTAKRLGVPCAVISAPLHVQDVPARHSPQVGWEGANVIFDAWVHPLMMGLEEHLLGMFRDDFEFHDGAAPSHLGARAPVAALGVPAAAQVAPAAAVAAPAPGAPRWQADAEAELRKIPFFVRPKARRNTERFAAERGVADISVEVLYEAKAHFSSTPHSGTPQAGAHAR